MKVLNDAHDTYKKAVAPIKDEFYAKMEAYYDAVLVDSNGHTIRVGQDVTDGKDRYKVEGRSLQFIFGRLINNPRISCHKYMKDRMGKKEFDFSVSSCKELTIVE